MEELQNIQDYIHVIRGHRVMLSQIATLKPRKPIGFIQPEENEEDDNEEKK